MYSSGISAPGGPKVAYSSGKSTSSYPHIQVTIAGKHVHVSRLSLSINAHGATNEGTITASLLADGDWSSVLNRKIADQVDAAGKLLPGVVLPKQSTRIDPAHDKPVPVVIDAGFTSDALPSIQAYKLTRLFSGLVDNYRPTFQDGQIEFTIRSMASVLIQDKIQTSVENMSTVAFIQECAKRWSLPTPEIILRNGQQPLSLPAVYAQRELVGIHNLRRWDLAKYCAQADDVQIWESNGVIHYVEPGSVKRKELPLTYGTSILAMDGNHAVMFNKEIEVFVHSYKRRKKLRSYSRTRNDAYGNRDTSSGSSVSTSNPVFGFAEENSTTTDSKGNVTNAHSSSSGGSSNSGATGTGYNESTKERYVYDIPGLDRDGCNQRSIAIWRQISMHEYQVSFEIPVTPENFPFIDITTFFIISGCPYQYWNTKFWPRSIEHTFDKSGWRVKVNAVNHLLAEAAV